MHAPAPSPSMLAGGLLAVGTAGLGYAAGYEVRSFRLRRVHVPVLPAGQRPLRVLHLSDLHLVPRQTRKREWVRSLAALEPDLVVNTGDNLAHMDAVPATLDALEPLMRFPGVFVLGSNDYFAPMLKNPARYLFPDGRLPGVESLRPPQVRLPAHELVQGMTSAGWLDLTNRRDAVKVDGRTLEVVGVDDPHLRLDRYRNVSATADPSADLTIGVTHAPYRRVLDAMAADRARLIVAGHTHGGQLCLPGVGALVTNCDLDRSRAKGLSRWPVGGRPTAADPDPAWLHVSAGLGTSPYTPVRFACPPEATLMTLEPSAA